MPHKHALKSFVEGGIYHAYNRGVNKSILFHDDQDYRVFLHLLKYYLSPIESLGKNHPLAGVVGITIVRPRPLANLEKDIDLLAYCLMPNHFHLLLEQHTIDGMTKLMRRFMTTFALYSNARHHRVGYLFQSRYKAALIDSDAYLLHVSRYIHTNPLDLPNMTRNVLVTYPYSSLPYYFRQKHAVWIKPDRICSYFTRSTSKEMSQFATHTSYEDFMMDRDDTSLEIIGRNLAVDAED